MYIYKIVNRVNGRVYVGQTTEAIEQRFKRHMRYQKNGSDTKFYRAVRKYGVDNFYIEMIEEVEDRKQLNAREEYWIRKLDTVNSGYNSYYSGFASGGDTLSNHPDLEAIKDKIREHHKGGNNPHAVKIVCVDIQSDSVVYYDSMREYQDALGIPRHDAISRRCRGRIKSPLNNKYMFYYLDDYNKQSQETIESIASEKDISE